ncbi:hypothetical protein Belba_0227 [Belliella baltica DSM 15883]|uniref:Uncharacterized protein n=1 Tax=Belliella baltica (strain DSM 15883 / CIP 108006 / LMG 21964 / BA134) TaxID=866536 RepID=I3Z0X7_BELBD|nr:hypothetical protein Belba_0227 [Belliella baltica DSM 15883]
MQPFYEYPYLSIMVQSNLKKRKIERLRWGFAFVICLMTVLFFSYEPSQSNFLSRIINPIEFLKMEQENQFQKIFTRFFSPEIPERFKRL